MTTMGDRIKTRRIELDMSQDELAKLIGYKSRSSINKIESDGRLLPLKKIVEIANALGVTPTYIMGWDILEKIKNSNSSSHSKMTEVVKSFLTPTNEAIFLDKFSKLTEKNQSLIKELIDALLYNQSKDVKAEDSLKWN